MTPRALPDFDPDSGPNSDPVSDPVSGPVSELGSAHAQEAADDLAGLRARLADGPASVPRRAMVAGGEPAALALALALARAGAAVTLIEEDAHDLARSRDALRRAGSPPGLRLATDPRTAPTATLIVEASTCPATVRAAHLAALARHAAPGALLATLGAPDDAVPGLLVPGLLAAGLPDRSRFVALDGALRENALIEILATPTTAPATLATAQAVLRGIGALPLVTPRFLTAALIAAIEDATETLIFAGSTPCEVDAAMEDFGFEPGPCAAQDGRGLDRTRARHRAEAAAGTRRAALPVLERMVAEGRLGRKASVGWYRYPGGGGRVIDPLIEDLSREEARFAGTPSRPVTADTIRATILRALADTAAALLVQTGDAGAIELAATLGAGFPARHGGIMRLARNAPRPIRPAP